VVRHPSAIVPPASHFAQLILPDLFERLLISTVSFLDGHLGCHPPPSHGSPLCRSEQEFST